MVLSSIGQDPGQEDQFRTTDGLKLITERKDMIIMVQILQLLGLRVLGEDMVVEALIRVLGLGEVVAQSEEVEEWEMLHLFSIVQPT